MKPDYVYILVNAQMIKFVLNGLKTCQQMFKVNYLPIHIFYRTNFSRFDRDGDSCQ